MGITKKGKAWEWRNSIWILWTFTFLLNFVAFFWIGVRSKYKVYLLFGWMYLLLILIPALLSTIVPIGILDAIVISSWAASIVNAFLVRKAYLIRREYIVDNAVNVNEQLRQKILHEMNAVAQTPAQAPSQTQTTVQISEPPINTQTIDINTCSERDLASLPGVGIARAKRAIELRSQKGGFASCEEFTTALGIEPHFAVQIERMVTASPIPQTPQEEQSKGRTVDI